MNLEQTTELYASVLRQLLPEGVYDTAEMTHVADDIYAHAKALAQADIDAHRLLQVLETIPVDLLADYEREYGLPMQCMVPGSQTIEERIHVLRWIRQHRNVMNREYLEQILAIFDVTLVDVVKHRPMLCTAPCTSPVNTERLRYKVLLRLQYPMAANMSCIIENYLPGYLRVEWVVDMPWSEWILNSGYELVDDNIRYSAYKTNQRDYFDSYADFVLMTGLVRSLHDSDMQQWQAVKDAIKIITDIANYHEIRIVDETIEILPKYNKPSFSHNNVQFYDPNLGCDAYYSNPYKLTCSFTVSTRYPGRYELVVYFDDYGFYEYVSAEPIVELTWSQAETQKTSITLNSVAAQIIANTKSPDQKISLLAEAYVETVAQSIFVSNESKKFVKISDLLSQFELNKTLRT